MVYVRSINHPMLYKSKWLIKHNAPEYSNNSSPYKLTWKLDPIPSIFFPGKQGTHIIPFHSRRRVFSEHCRAYNKKIPPPLLLTKFSFLKMSTQFVACSIEKNRNPWIQTYIQYNIYYIPVDQIWFWPLCLFSRKNLQISSCWCCEASFDALDSRIMSKCSWIRLLLIWNDWVLCAKTVAIKYFQSNPKARNKSQRI